MVAAITESERTLKVLHTVGYHTSKWTADNSVKVTDTVSVKKDDVQ